MLCHPEDVESSAKRRTPDEGPVHLAASMLLSANAQVLRPAKSADLRMTRFCGSGNYCDDYCLMTVPSRLRISPHPPFRFSGPLVNGDLAAAFSSISIPQPGFSLTHKYPFFISGQPWKISSVRSLNGGYS